jgi:hypothetical protein
MKELYIGIDVHLKKHIVSMVPFIKFQDNKTEWKNTKSVAIGNNRHDFEYLEFLIKSQSTMTNQVTIAIDYQLFSQI